METIFTFSFLTTREFPSFKKWEKVGSIEKFNQGVNNVYTTTNSLWWEQA